MLNKFKQQYNKLEEVPSSNVWDQLEQRLDGNSRPVAPKKSSKQWLSIAAAVVVLLTLGNLFWMFNNKQNTSKIVARNKPTITVVKPSENTEAINRKEDAIITQKKSEIAKTPTIPVVKDIEKINNYSPIIENSSVSTPTQLIESTPKLADSKEKKNYVNSSDLLFSVELDKTRKEQASPNAKLGLNDIKSVPKDNHFTPKSLKIFGITVYENDSSTTK